MRKELIGKANRIVIKSGTSSLTDESSRLDTRKISNLVEQLMNLKKHGKELILVSSGAIGAGMGRIKLSSRPQNISKLQATAAIGQGILMHIYERFFENYNQPIAQVLLSKDDFTHPEKYKNLRSTLEILMLWGVIPIVNENDTVAIEEIKVGDNDTLAAFVSVGVEADLLVILTDVDGLHTDNPEKNSNSKLVSIVEKVTPEVESWASRAGKGFGGMYTKVQAAKMLAEKSIPTIIANGSEPDILNKVLHEDIGTLFLPGEKKS